ncbi:hypothetical protein C5167_032879 [Papaver somniferum]|uniref:Uncharacterized protein n=1 Tax=Papaver somniferum TaxID=3469 RepID=A0A4Y7KAC5_PAPSO|nr:hypothetical protein C5167_032879 [Papaver somniferum]
MPLVDLAEGNLDNIIAHLLWFVCYRNVLDFFGLRPQIKKLPVQVSSSKESQVQNSDMKNPPLPALSGANYHASPADLRRPSLASADVDPSAAPHPK